VNRVSFIVYRESFIENSQRAFVYRERAISCDQRKTINEQRLNNQRPGQAMTTSDTIQARFELLLARLLTASQERYGARLVSLAVFGSVGRGTPRIDSDVDLLIVADELPRGRLPRVAEFRDVEMTMAFALAQARASGLTADLSPVIETPAEVLQGSLLFLDMVEDARLLYDRANFMRQALSSFKARLDRLGARRIWRGNAWIWDLKPDYKPGEVFEL